MIVNREMIKRSLSLDSTLIARAVGTVNVNILPTSSPQPTRIGYKYDFEMWFTTTDIGAYSSMVLILDAPSETNPVPIKNRFCRQITLTVNGSINKPSSSPYYETADFVTDLVSHAGTKLGSFSVTGPASMRFTFSLVPVVTMSAPVSYTIKYLLQYSINGSKTLTILGGSYPLNFGGPEDVSGLEDKTVPYKFAGPSTMKLNETNYFSFNISLDRISPTVVMKAMWYHPTLKHGISVMNMMLVQFGPFWSCCMFTPSFKHFPPIFDPNEGEVGNKGLTLIIVHVYGYDKTVVGNTFTLYAALIVDGVILLNASINFTVAGANLTSLPTISSSAVSWSAAVGGVAATLLSIQLPRSVQTDYSLIVMTNTCQLKEAQSYMTSYYLQQGAHIYNIPYVAEYPQLTTMQFYFQK
uniref:Uncharacterized protein n=1 Tax=Romanomermis culicivorax TaxID=13658 RepID=A0A915I6C4_ROMCU